LAYGAGLGVVPVSTLRAVALQAFDHPAGAQADHVLVCNDARMQETYWCAYRRSVDAGTGLALPEPIRAEAVGAPESVVRPTVDAGGAPLAPEARWTGAGRGFRAYPALESTLPAGVVAPAPLVALLPQAAAIVALARPEVAAGAVAARRRGAAGLPARRCGAAVIFLTHAAAEIWLSCRSRPSSSSKTRRPSAR
jgi:tRNA A37 threonylcarbamoyladenosine modification protein TsaB